MAETANFEFLEKLNGIHIERDLFSSTIVSDPSDFKDSFREIAKLDRDIVGMDYGYTIANASDLYASLQGMLKAEAVILDGFAGLTEEVEESQVKLVVENVLEKTHEYFESVLLYMRGRNRDEVKLRMIKCIEHSEFVLASGLATTIGLTETEGGFAPEEQISLLTFFKGLATETETAKRSIPSGVGGVFVGAEIKALERAVSNLQGVEPSEDSDWMGDLQKLTDASTELAGSVTQHLRRQVRELRMSPETQSQYPALPAAAQKIIDEYNEIKRGEKEMSESDFETNYGAKSIEITLGTWERMKNVFDEDEIDVVFVESREGSEGNCWAFKLDSEYIVLPKLDFDIDDESYEYWGMKLVFFTPDGKAPGKNFEVERPARFTKDGREYTKTEKGKLKPLSGAAAAEPEQSAASILKAMEGAGEHEEGGLHPELQRYVDLGDQLAEVGERHLKRLREITGGSGDDALLCFKEGTACTQDPGISMEDSISITIKNKKIFAAVYGGHGRIEAAEIVNAKELSIFEDKYLDIRDKPKVPASQAFEETYEELYYGLIKRQVESGATATNIYFDGSALFCANIGGTRVVLVKRSGEEAISEPYTTGCTITGGDLAVIVACNGLWDVVENSEAASCVRRYAKSGLDADAAHNDGNQPPHQAAEALKDLAIKKGATDNVAVVVIMFYAESM